MRRIIQWASCLLFGLAAASVASCAIQRTAPPIPKSTVILGAQPKIPREFFGCWQGTVSEYDTAKSYSVLSDETIRAAAANTTYQFCFTPRPDGTGQLDLKKVEVGGDEIIVKRFDNRVTALDPEHYRGSLRNHLIGESIIRLLWIFPLHVQQEIYAEEDLQMKSPDLIAVAGRQLVVIRGKVFAEMSFHTDFHRIPATAAGSSP